MGRKENRELKQAMNKMDMNEMIKVSALSDFRTLTTIGFLNKLAMLTTQDNSFLYTSQIVENFTGCSDEELATITASNIVIHDEAGVSESGVEGYPIVARINGRDSEGKLVVEYADTVYGSSLMHFRAVRDGEDTFLTVFCEGADQTILITDGEWFTA